MNESTPLRVGVIGIGFGQHVHVPAFRRDPRLRVDAIGASSVERARPVAERLGIPRAHGDWRELVADPELDALALSVPPRLQFEVALAALRAKKHLFAEKPLATSTAEAQALLDAAASAGVVGAVDFEFRVVPAWLAARRILTSGELGRVRRAYVTWRLETYAYRTHQRSWKRDGDGGVLNLFVSHSFDSVEWLFGRVARLAARLEPSSEGDARADVWLEVEGGPAVSLSAGMDLPGGSGHRVEIYGDEGALVLENTTSDHIAGFTLKKVSRAGEVTAVELPAPKAGEDGRITAVAEIVRRFADAVQTGGVMTPGL
ncbi:MAG TPA: Gfo/Idh/MocA family oxidoreductase, partial [Polyangiaceae bacterium]|nr:Gfo/Idh/MocA family oxidoreductase [Polyangiaceae bacterium]